MQVSSISHHIRKQRRSKSNSLKPATRVSSFSMLDFFKADSTFKLPIDRVPTGQKDLQALSGRVVLVTGGSRGIGKATCERFAQAGCTVIGTARRADEGGAKSSGYRLLSLDVRSDESVKSCIDEIIERHGRIDILVNNAGIGQYGRLIKAKPKDWNAILETNLIGVHRVTTAAYPYMKGPDCRIITLGSLEGETGYPYQALYAISKRALQLWNDSFDFEQRNENGPRFSLLEPSWVNTGFGMSADIINTEPDTQDPYARIAKELFPRFLEQYGIEPAEVAEAIFTIAAMQRPHLRYFIGIKGAVLMGQSLEDMLTMIYTQPPETMLAFLDAFAKITYNLYKK